MNFSYMKRIISSMKTIRKFVALLLLLWTPLFFSGAAYSATQMELANATTHEVAIEPSVSEDQYEDLLATATDVGANLQIFCKLYNIDSLRDIKASNFESAKKALLAKKRKAA